MGCSINHIQIIENHSYTLEITQDLQEDEISILTIHEGIKCLKTNIEQNKLNYPDDIIVNQVQEQFIYNLSSQSSSVSLDCPVKKSCLKQINQNCLTLFKYASKKKVQFNISSQKFSKKRKYQKRQRSHYKQPIDLDEIF
ncbi:unnamed protein product [Paramecium sonneborni]|uniref:Uncharacterized protein n=1 Tax=Paramecium sonneborni TaxID=65129 RepID=A0A8S1RHV9_9CILI|nr:unnamed protein product [Paramecium sonneborni]